MSFVDMLYQTGAILFSSLGGAGIILALSSWLGKVWANRVLEKDRLRYHGELEGIKSDYREQVERNLHELHDRIQKGQFVHRLQFDMEFNIYKDLWKSVMEVWSAAHDLRPVLSDRPIPTDEESKRERLIELSKSHGVFRHCFQHHKPFIAERVYEVCHELSSVVFEEGVDFNYMRPDVNEDYWQKAQQNSDRMRELADSICQEIRSRIGVLQPLPEVDSEAVEL